MNKILRLISICLATSILTPSLYANGVINSLVTVSKGLPLIDFSPATNSESLMNNGLTQIKQNDGLVFSFNTNPFGVRDMAPSIFPMVLYNGSQHSFSFNDGIGSGAILFQTKNDSSLYMSENGYYAKVNYPNGNSPYKVSVYAPNGEHYYFNASYIVPAPPYHSIADGPSNTFSIKSRHNKDIITFKPIDTGSYTYPYLGIYTQTASNGYVLTSNRTVNNVSDNVGRIWINHNSQHAAYIYGITMPTGYEYKASMGYPTRTYTSPQGLKVLINPSEINITGSAVEPYKIAIKSTYSPQVGSNLNPYYTQLTYPNGDSVVYSYASETDKGGAGIPVNTMGLLTSKVIKNIAGTVIYNEKNTYTAINGVQALTEKYVTQDRVTSKTIYSDFNAYNKPQKIVKTASNGETLTTSIVYNITGAPSVDGAIFLIQPKTITKVNGDGKTLYSEKNTYDSDGFLMNKTLNGVLTSYTYDEMGNIKTKTDASGNVWTYNNYMSGYPQETIDPDGNKTEYVYDSRGLMLSETDSKGNKTTYKYDPKSWKIIKETPPTGNPITYTYSNYFKTVVETQGTNVKTTNYDSLGRIMNVTDEDTKTDNKYIVVHKYDLNHNKEFTSYPCSDIAKCTLGTVKQVDILGRTVNLIQNTTWTAGE